MVNNNQNLDSFEDSEYSIIKGLNFESPCTRMPSPKIKLSISEEREISIREIQFQEKMKEIKRIKKLHDNLNEELNLKKWNQFQDVLVKSNKRYIQSYLFKYNKNENKSVERISRSKSVFNKSKFASTVKNKVKRNFRILIYTIEMRNL